MHRRLVWVKSILQHRMAACYLLLPDSQPCANGIRGRVGSASEPVAMVVAELTDPCCTASLVTRTTALGDGASFTEEPTLNLSVLRCCSCRCCNMTSTSRDHVTINKRSHSQQLHQNLLHSTPCLNKKRVNFSFALCLSNANRFQ